MGFYLVTKQIDETKLRCPGSGDAHWPVARSRIMTVISSNAGASRLLLGDRVIDMNLSLSF
jgi:hypothetical protein